MIVVRRALVVPLLVVLTLVLTVTLVAQRVNSTLLSPGFHEEQLTAIGAFDAVHEEILPTALDNFLDEQEERIPENLEGIALPTDAASRDVMLEFARTALPPEELEAQAATLIESLVSYLRGEREDLDWNVSLHGVVDTAFLESGASGTAFEEAWTDLDLTETAVVGLSRGIEVPEVTGFETPADEDALGLVLGAERDEAVQWLEAELFTAVRELSSYFAGESERFSVRIEFDRYPELVPVMATALNTDPQTLLRDGFRLNSVDIQRELDASDDPPVENLEEARTIFTPAGRAFGIDDLQRGDGADPEGGGLDLDRVRAVLGPASTWVVPAGATIALWLAASVGFLGGRAWWSRATWAATALAAPAALIAIVAGPVAGSLVLPRLSDALAESKADLVADDSPWTPLGVRALDQIELVAGAQAGSVATTALLVAVVAVALGAAAVGRHVYATRRAEPSPETSEPAPLPLSDEVEEPARAA